MKRSLFILLSGYICLIASAQNSKIINVSTAGTLSALLTTNEKTSVTNLKVTGEIDARDVKCMRDEMTALAVLDISAVSIKSYNGDGGTLSYLSSYYESTLPKNSFFNSDYLISKTSLTSILLPASLKSIDSFAFNYCTGLASISIPNLVTSIGQNAFMGTAWFNNQQDGMVYFGNVAYAYKGVMPLNTSVSIKIGTVSISPYAFNGKSELKSISLPISLKEIGEAAFSSCTKLSILEVPDEVSFIGKNAFLNTTWYDNQPNGIVYAGKVLYNCKGILPANSKIDVKSGTLSIGYKAFADQTNLISITIPNSVINIGTSAFSNCILLTEMTIPNSVTSIRASAFAYCSGLKSISIPNSLVSIDQETFKYCTNITTVNIPKSVINIYKGAFMGCASLATLYLPNSIKYIEQDAFWGLKRLKSIYSSIETPMALDYNHFEESDKAYCTLYVPKGTRTTYLNTTGWKYFLNIVEFDATVLNSPTLNDLEINFKSTTKSIVVKGIDKPFSIAIYNINGEMCYLNELKEPNQNIYTSKLTQGIYIVKVNVNNEVISRKIQVF